MSSSNSNKSTNTSGNKSLSKDASRGGLAFLTDGHRIVRYRDLPKIVANAHQILKAHLHPCHDRFTSRIFPENPVRPKSRAKSARLDSRGPYQGRPPVIAIDTSDRFEAILWMVYCWEQTIPFVPWSFSYPGPLNLYAPDILLSSERLDEFSPEGDLNPKQMEGGTNRSFHADISLSQSPLSGSVTEPAEENEPVDPGIRIPSTANPDALFCGLTTSGSSGRPKRVALLRRNIIAAARNAFRCLRAEPATDHALWGNCLPLYHTGGLAIVFRALLSGSGIYLWDRFEPERISRDLQHNADIFGISLVPTMMKRLLDHSAASVPDAQGYRASSSATAADTAAGSGAILNVSAPSSLRQVLLGGGPASTNLIRDARKAGWPVCFSYGMTETCGQIAAQSPDRSSHEGSVGLPFPDHDVEIRNDSGHPLPAKSVGALWVRGPQVFPGYVDDKLDHAAGGPDCRGWFHTGDIGWIDIAGNLFIEARRTDLILSGGENINPEEVESVLRSCPGVADAGVTGVADEEWGQIVVALVVPAETSKTDKADSGKASHKSSPNNSPLSIQTGETDVIRKDALAEDIRAFALKNLPASHRPKKILFTRSLPRTGLGKPERKKLQEQAKDLLSGK
ncbi:MAG: AMP-binding protein [Cyclonatronaceae bacterium]